MKSLSEHLSIFALKHSNRINRWMHFVGIPLTFFSLMMFFNWISIDIATQWQISFSWIILAYMLVFYFLLNIRIALIASIILIPLTLLAILIARPIPTHFSLLLFLILFIVGIILHLAGHFFEKQKPTFLMGYSQFFIGPLFVLTELMKAFGVSRLAKRDDVER